VNELKNLENPELKRIFYKQLLRGLLFLLVLVTFIFAVAFVFQPQINEIAEWMIERFGFLGLSASVFVADLIVSPIPPDAALYLIGQSTMHDQWAVWVPLLGLVSSGAGVCGWLVGKRLQHLRFFRKLIVTYGREHRGKLRRYGFWMVVIGALTPLPFSLTCWLAGIIKLPLQTFVIAALVRVPRFVLYYWAIFYSSEVGSLLRNLL
jgi:membrane protein YqaA with SNARE-associated domain